MNKQIFNFGWGVITVQFVNEEPTGECEMLIYDSIGKDPWSGAGISAADFKKALDAAPKDRQLNVKINSKGGDVHEGIAMQNELRQWKAANKQKLVTTIVGVAASTASWLSTTVSDEVRSYRNAQVFVHDAMAMCFGNAEDLEKLAEKLDKVSDQIAGMYAEKTGKGVRTWRDKMKNETLMTGEEAEEEGLVDVILDEKAVNRFTPRELTNMSNRLASVYNSAARRGGDKPQQEQENKMDKKKLKAVLNKHGVTVWNGNPITDETSVEDLLAALETIENITDDSAIARVAEIEKKAKAAAQKDSSVVTRNELTLLQNELNEFKKIANTQRELRIGNQLDKLIGDDKLTLAEKPAALKRAMADETYVDELTSRPSRPVGANPLQPLIDCVSNSFADVQTFILNNSQGFMRNFIGHRAADNGEHLGEKVCKDICNHSLMVANTIKKHKEMLISMFNTNNIDAGLQRQIILQEMLEEFAVILKSLQMFSTVFSNVPLEGTDEVDVPFYPLATDAGTSWDPAVGYTTFGDTTTNTRPVIVGGSGVTSGAAAPAGTARDRKFIGAQFSSYELARQPYLNVQKLMIQKSNRLAVLIFQDIVSRVITAANYGASIKSEGSATFSADDIADLWENATGRNWPDAGRALFLDHTYKTPLLKDPSFKQYLAAGTTETLRQAAIKEAYGFQDIPIIPNLTSYSPANEYLVGWINWMYAVLVATAPIMPTPDVRALMTRYDVVVHPSVGIAFEYRRFGDTTLDKTKEVIECSYGAAKGVASALARITSQ